MFTRIVECQAKKGKTEEVAKKVRNEVLPILQKQPGFIDLVALRDSKDDERIVCLSFWNSKENAEIYHREHYGTIVQMLSSELQANPGLETLQVEISTAHRIAVGRAA
jgi:heme-degrading monooxygenase HmoA